MSVYVSVHTPCFPVYSELWCILPGLRFYTSSLNKLDKVVEMFGPTLLPFPFDL